VCRLDFVTTSDASIAATNSSLARPSATMLSSAGDNAAARNSAGYAALRILVQKVREVVKADVIGIVKRAGVRDVVVEADLSVNL